MITETAIQILQNHNDWRRGKSDKKTDATEYGEALDFAIAELSRNKDILEIVKAQYEEEKELRDKYQGKQNGYKYAHRAAALRELLKKITV